MSSKETLEKLDRRLRCAQRDMKAIIRIQKDAQCRIDSLKKQIQDYRANAGETQQ